MVFVSFSSPFCRQPQGFVMKAAAVETKKSDEIKQAGIKCLAWLLGRGQCTTYMQSAFLICLMFLGFDHDAADSSAGAKLRVARSRYALPSKAEQQRTQTLLSAISWSGRLVQGISPSSYMGVADASSPIGSGPTCMPHE